MEKNFKLVVVEGVDSCGKETQTNLLYNRLCGLNLKVEKIGFPNYESDTSALVKMYLNGEFGSHAYDVNPYVASTFFAADRAGSMLGMWKERLCRADVVIADRYVTSNMIHQASKITDLNEKSRFIDWLYDFEYNKLDLPKPDVVVFLDMPVENSIELMKNRPNKIDSSSKKDIHESDLEYMKKSYNNAVYIANKYLWHTVSCVKDSALRSIEDISDEVFDIVNDIL